MEIGTHDGSIHADETCGVGELLILFPEARIIRTRSLARLAQCDIVLDAGRVYNESTFRFDHHQEGGAGTRENGIMYSAFGLVHRRFGPEACMSVEIARMMDRQTVSAVDAQDNGQELIKRIPVPGCVNEKGEVTKTMPALNFKGVRPTDISLVINGFNPTWEEDPSESDARFRQAVEFARGFLLREIAHKRAMIAAREPMRAIVKEAADKRLIVLERFIPWKLILVNESEALYVVYPGLEGRWRVECVTTSMDTFEKRKALPAAWAGQVDEKFAAITGVTDARFCHKECFVCGADTREGALALARMALEA